MKSGHLAFMKAAAYLLFIPFSLLLSSPAQSQSKRTIDRMGEANCISFDTNWRFARFGLQADGTTVPEPQGLEDPGYDDSQWRKVDLPHDWAIEGPFRIDLEGETGKLPYQGIGWYRKHFSVSRSESTAMMFVDFDGAMAYAQVWLNGQYLGTWPYGYTSFRMNLTPYLKYGQGNVLTVRLDTEKWQSRWYPGAGIYRHVWLVKTHPVHVGHWGTYVTTPEINESSARVNIDVTVENQWDIPVNALVRTTVFPLDDQNNVGSRVTTFEDKTVSIEPGTEGKVSSSVTIEHPLRWDVLAPNRYLAQTTIRVNGKLLDTYYTPFGIRTIEFTALNGFRLNGRRVPIQGTCNHHDLGALGAAVNTSALQRELRILKQMGCNALRTSHNPPAPELIDLADRMGFLVWDEAFDCWKKGKREWDYNKLFDEWHEKDLRAMVMRDRNNPSVFIWSIGNEVPDQKNVEMTRQLAEIVRSVDPTRPVSNGYNDPNGSREAGSPLSLNIMGVNYFFGQQARWDADPRYANMPTIGSETSSCVSSRGVYFTGKPYRDGQIASYDQAHPGWGCTPDEQFRVNAKFPSLLGEFVWTGFDYLGEPTPFNSETVDLKALYDDTAKRAELDQKLAELQKTTPHSRSSYFGIVDLAGFPKDRYYLYMSQWLPEVPMAHILPHWNWKDSIGKIIPVNVYTSGTEAELFLNGKSLGRKVKRPGQDFRLVWDSVRYEPGKLEVIAYRDGKKWATDLVRTTGEPYRLILSADQRKVSSDSPELSYVTVRVTDKQGLTVPDANPPIRFEIDGPGVIVATDNGDATSFVPFQSHDRPAFNGLALVIVKARKSASAPFTVRAMSEGLVAGSVTIDVLHVTHYNE